MIEMITNACHDVIVSSIYCFVDETLVDILASKTLLTFLTVNFHSSDVPIVEY